MKLKESLVTRRQFIEGWLTSTAALFAGMISYPLFQFLTPKALGAGPSEVKLPLEELNVLPNSAKIFKFGRKPGLLIMTEKKEWIALSAVCTHFECTVHYEPGIQGIACPCHKGFFDMYGNNIKGPPPRPLERYNVTQEPDGLLISKEVKEKKK